MENMKNAKGEKLYPFSMKKYGHDIEYAYNFLRNVYDEMLVGEKEWDDNTYYSFESIRDIYSRAISAPVFWATGKEIGNLKRWALWAESRRAGLNRMNA